MMKKRGATLIELLVVIVTSAIILSAVMASFASLIKVTQRIDVSRQLQKEINFALIRIADKMRAHSIDYGAYKEGICSSLNQEYGTKVCIGGGNVFEKGKVENNLNYWNLFMNGEPLFSETFDVKEVLIFDITPPKELSMKDFQPKLTVYLDVSSIYYPDINFQIQTTLSSRKYE